MDAYELINNMTLEEKKKFSSLNANGYFQYLVETETFQKVKEKLNSPEEVTEEEWSYILEKLFLVTCKSFAEEERISLFDELLHLITKIGLRYAKKDSIFYKECFVIKRYIESMMMQKDLNLDLCYGLDTVIGTMKKEDLSILLQQHEESLEFRDNFDYFVKKYSKRNEKNNFNIDYVSVNSLSRSYIREKELVLRYKTVV